MKSGTAIVVVVLVGYLGFEVYAVRKVGYRMEPDYIHNLMVEARTATEFCNSRHLAMKDRFEQTLTRVTELYRNVLAEEHPQWSQRDIDERLAERTQAAEQAVQSELAATDCDDQAMKNHFQRYRIYAKRS